MVSADLSEWEIPTNFKDTCLQHNPSWDDKRIFQELRYLELIQKYKSNVEFYEQTGDLKYKFELESTLNEIVIDLNGYVRAIISKILPKDIDYFSVVDELMSIALRVIEKYLNKYHPPVPFSVYIAKPLRAYFESYLHQISSDATLVPLDEDFIDSILSYGDPAIVYETKSSIYEIVDLLFKNFSNNPAKLMVMLIGLGFNFETILVLLQTEYQNLLDSLKKNNSKNTEQNIYSVEKCLELLQKYYEIYLQTIEEQSNRGLVINRMDYNMISTIFNITESNVKYFISTGKNLIKAPSNLQIYES